jgi:hypothetical protein
MQATVKSATPGMGFDVNQQLSAGQATAFREAGYLFCVRYLPRTPLLIPGNLTAAEIEIILGAGLALMAVQHVPNPGWDPTADLGEQYGNYAVQYAQEIGLPNGINIFLDLEEVAAGATPQDVIDYCHAWAASVEVAGYVPGVYVGWNIKLSDQQLYANLPFKNYWRAYNCDQSIPTRGYQILQKIQQVLDGVTFDPDVLQTDNMGDVPVWAVADNS